jgi:lambda family phage portal protein
MSRWLKALAVVAPNAALRRAHALQALRYYDGARKAARTNSLASKPGSPNVALSSELARLTARAHDLVRNTPEGARTIEILSSLIVGTGVKVIFKTGNARLDKKLQRLWNRWCKIADIEGVLGLEGLQKLAIAGMFEGGDTLTRLVDVVPPRRGQVGYGLPALRLQLLEGEQLDLSRDRISVGEGGNRVRFGIELDEWNRRLAFHVTDGDSERLTLTDRSRRIAAADVCHLYRPQRPGQLRGVTVFAPVMLASRDHADLIEALTVKARMEACFGLGVETPEAGKMTLMPNDPDRKAPDGKPIEEMNPGMILYLRPGEKLQSVSPTGGLAAEPIILANLMRFAAGVNLAYDQVTGDLRKANYSSLKAGDRLVRRFVEQVQWLNLVPMLMDRIVDRWLDRAILGGLIADRREGYAYDYVMPAREPIDPKKDLEADILAVRSGRMSPQEFISEWGRDWREVLDDTTAFLKELDARGIVLDIDPRRTTQTGAAQTAAEPPEDEDDPE